jgi:CRP/FNR family cyclic AMP-dependent transcriptional regulator
MKRQNFQNEELILKQGDSGGFVFQIESGEVEVFIEESGRTVVLGTVGPDEFLGEMGAIGGNAFRSASARARGTVTVNLMDREEFLHMVSGDTDLSYRIIERLSERLRSANNKLAEAALPTLANEEFSILIYPAGKEVESQMPQGGMRVGSLPFSVGRMTRRKDPSKSNPDLALSDSNPFNLSRLHFSISKLGEKVVVYDLESTLGTEVNGEALGKYFGKDYALLQHGDNTVIAGGHSSPFTFRVNLT